MMKRNWSETDAPAIGNTYGRILTDAVNEIQELQGARDAALAEFEERAQMCRELAHALNVNMRMIEQAHKLVTQWLSRPEPPNTGELVALATILEGKQQPEAGREVENS